MRCCSPDRNMEHTHIKNNNNNNNNSAQRCCSTCCHLTERHVAGCHRLALQSPEQTLGPQGLLIVRSPGCAIMVDAMVVWLNTVIAGVELWRKPQTRRLCQISHFPLAQNDFKIHVFFFFFPPLERSGQTLFSEPEGANIKPFSASFPTIKLESNVL